MIKKIGLFVLFGFMGLMALGAIGAGIDEATNDPVQSSEEVKEKALAERDEVKQEEKSKEAEKDVKAASKEPEEEEKKEVVKKEEKPKEEKKEAKQEEKPKVEKVVSKPKKEEPKMSDAEQKVIRQYQEDVITYTTNMSNYLGKLSEQNLMVGDDITLLFDQSWIINTAGAVAGIGITVDEFEKVTPPDQFKESHALIEKANEHFMFVVNNYPEAVDARDADRIVESSDHMRMGGETIAEATGILETEIANVEKMGYKKY